MVVTLFQNVKAQKGEVCSYEKFMKVSESTQVTELCAKIARESDHEKQQRLKKWLPLITWHASFDGPRKNELAKPSGLFMLDMDGVEEPLTLWESIESRKEELGILLAHKTPSTHGLRLVCKCRPELKSIDECQQWLAKEIGVEHDPACKDFARASYVVPQEYIFFIDEGLFSMEPETVYEVNESNPLPSPADSTPDIGAQSREGENTSLTYKGIDLREIAKEWLLQTGGEPVKGERNTRLHSLAFDLRYITEFNEATLKAVMPTYGLGETEMRSLIHSACTASRMNEIPKRLGLVLKKLQGEVDNTADIETLAKPEMLPPLPSPFKEIIKSFPTDFKAAAIECMLPVLGTLGSRLGAIYLDGKMHTPSFMVSLEAPQANGKSLITEIAKELLECITKRDEEVRNLEMAYSEKAAEAKKKDKEASVARPKGIVRVVPATISVTKLMMRLYNSQGLHLICVAPEVHEVVMATKKEYANYSCILRESFDNDIHGQDYAKDDSFSGMVKVYFNTLFCGTPKAMKQLYPDMENGLVSRVLFVTVPDQFGKPMPVRSKMSEKEVEEVKRQIERLDNISFANGEVQPQHVMDMSFLNRVMKSWIDEQRKLAVRTNDRTRDIFYRRAAVVGFRAGMLAWFLYGENDTRRNRNRTAEFARWIANQMLNQFLLRFPQMTTVSNVNRWVDAYNQLGDEFSRQDVVKALYATGSSSPVKKVISLWQLGGFIKSIEVADAANGNKEAVKFKKVR